MEEGERTFTPGQAEAMDALLSGRNVFLSGNAGTGMLYVALSRCTTFDGLTVWPKIERQRLYANESVIEFYDSLAAKAEEVHEPSQVALFDVDAPMASLAVSTESTEPMKPGNEDKVYIKCPVHLAERVRGYIDALMEVA